MLQIRCDQVELGVDPWMGGGVTYFKWRGVDIFRPFASGGDTLDLANFPLVPFCNRIANGTIGHLGKPWSLPRAPLGTDPEHAIHGIGWRSPWSTLEAGKEMIRLGLKHDGALWPWAFSAEQRFELSPSGLNIAMSATNHASMPMPTGLGLHPYFPREGAQLEFEASAHWETGEDRLPTSRRELSGVPNWFADDGFDHCFEGDSESLAITWPSHRLRICPSSNLSFTHIYTPPGADFFCVEPVSHIPDAVNSPLDKGVTGLAMLEPGETMQVECRFEVEAIS